MAISSKAPDIEEPFWEDVSSYDYTKNHSIRDWGWEFIRRNPKYLCEWKEELTRFNAGEKSDFAKTALNEINTQGIKAMKLLRNDIDPSSYADFLIQSDNAHKWGMECFQDPRAKNLVWHNRYPTRFDMALDGINVEALPREKDTLHVCIDLRCPLKPQIEKLQYEAYARQRDVKNKELQLTRNAQRAWTRYLRILDVEFFGKTRKEAAPILFPNEENVPSEEQWDGAK